TALAEPVARFWFSITSTGPNRRRIAAISAARCGWLPGIMARWLAVPNVAAARVGGVLLATAAPRTVPATATVISDSTSNCWRHSRRNSRHAQRITACRAGAPPSAGRAEAGRSRTDVVTGFPPSPAVTPGRAPARPGQPAARRAGTPPGQRAQRAGRREG